MHYTRRCYFELRRRICSILHLVAEPSRHTILTATVVAIITPKGAPPAQEGKIVLDRPDGFSSSELISVGYCPGIYLRECCTPAHNMCPSCVHHLATYSVNLLDADIPKPLPLNPLCYRRQSFQISRNNCAGPLTYFARCLTQRSKTLLLGTPKANMFCLAFGRGAISPDDLDDDLIGAYASYEKSTPADRSVRCRESSQPADRIVCFLRIQERQGPRDVGNH